MFGTPITGAHGSRVRQFARLIDEGSATWRRRAACKGLDPGTFHPDDRSDDPDSDEVAPGAVSAAKEICAACPVREACLEHALAAREPDGIWGGLTAQERRRELRRRRRTA